MSMISSLIDELIDELRKSADEWNGSNMFELARMCREAADTIWELRDDLQRANAENAKLRELVRAMWLYDYAGKFSSASDDVEHVAMVYQSMRELGVEL